MDNIERYLRLATWGLWGEHKRTVRMELSSHIHHKANQYEALGYTPSAAVSRALSDLGPPHVVSAGMNGVYTMPNILRNTLLCAVLATLGVGNLTSSMAQVTGTTRLPIKECAGGQSSFNAGKNVWRCEQASLWISLSSLRITLEPKGVKFSQVGEKAAQPATILRFPGASMDAQITQQRNLTYMTGRDSAQSFESNLDFIGVDDFITALGNIGLPVQISGWDNPQIKVGETSFTLGETKSPVSGKSVYNSAISRKAIEALFPSITKNVSEDRLVVTTFLNPIVFRVSTDVGYGFRIKVPNTRVGDVIVVLSREGPTDLFQTAQGQTQVLQSVRRAFMGPVGEDGTVFIKSPSKSIIVSSPDKLPRCVSDGAGTISVLRFSGRIDSSATDTLTRVAPEDVTVQAVK